MFEYCDVNECFKVLASVKTSSDQDFIRAGEAIRRILVRPLENSEMRTIAKINFEAQKSKKMLLLEIAREHLKKENPETVLGLLSQDEKVKLGEPKDESQEANPELGSLSQDEKVLGASQDESPEENSEKANPYKAFLKRAKEYLVRERSMELMGRFNKDEKEKMVQEIAKIDDDTEKEIYLEVEKYAREKRDLPKTFQDLAVYLIENFNNNLTIIHTAEEAHKEKMKAAEVEKHNQYHKSQVELKLKEQPKLVWNEEFLRLSLLKAESELAKQQAVLENRESSGESKEVAAKKIPALRKKIEDQNKLLEGEIARKRDLSEVEAELKRQQRVFDDKTHREEKEIVAKRIEDLTKRQKGLQSLKVPYQDDITYKMFITQKSKDFREANIKLRTYVSPVKKIEQESSALRRENLLKFLQKMPKEFFEQEFFAAATQKFLKLAQEGKFGETSVVEKDGKKVAIIIGRVGSGKEMSFLVKDEKVGEGGKRVAHKMVGNPVVFDDELFISPSERTDATEKTLAHLAAENGVNKDSLDTGEVLVVLLGGKTIPHKMVGIPMAFGRELLLLAAQKTKDPSQLLEYLLTEKGYGKDFLDVGEVAITLLEKGAQMDLDLYVDERTKRVAENKILSLLLQNRAIESKLTERLCNYFIENKQDAYLIFQLIRYQDRQQGFSRMRMSSQTSFDSVSSRASSSSGAGAASFGNDEVLEMFKAVIRKALENKAINSAQDKMDDPDSHEVFRQDLSKIEKSSQTIPEFLLQQSAPERVGGLPKSETAAKLWTEIQKSDNLDKLLPEVYEHGTFLHQIIAARSQIFLKKALDKIDQLPEARRREIFSRKDEDGRTPFHLACTMGYDYAIEKLYSEQVFQMEDDLGATPLMQIINTPGYANSLNVLLEKRIDVESESPLIIAILKGQESMTEALLKYGANPNAVHNIRGVKTTPLKTAVEERNNRVLEALIGHGVNLRKADGEYVDEYLDYKTSSEEVYTKLDAAEKSFQAKREAVSAGGISAKSATKVATTSALEK